MIDADPRHRHRSIPTFIPLMGFFIPIPGHLWIGISSGMWDTPEGQPCASTAVVTRTKPSRGQPGVLGDIGGGIHPKG